MEHSDLKNRNDSFIGRLIVSCPFPTRHMWNEFQEAATAVKTLTVYQQNFLCLLQEKRSITGSKGHYFFHTFDEFAEEFDQFDIEYQMAGIFQLESNIGFEGSCSLMRASYFSLDFPDTAYYGAKLIDIYLVVEKIFLAQIWALKSS